MKLIAILLLAVPFASAGVVRFTAKHVVKPSAKAAYYPVRHPKQSAKSSGHAASNSAKFAAKVLF